MNVPAFVKSRKFWALIIGAALVVLRTYVPQFPVSDEQLGALALMIVSYILGTGLEDAGRAYARPAGNARSRPAGRRGTTV